MYLFLKHTKQWKLPKTPLPDIIIAFYSQLVTYFYINDFTLLLCILLLATYLFM